MEIGLAVGGAFLSSALNVLFDRLAPQGDLLNMFQKHTDDVQLFEKLGDILLGLQIVLSDAENKQASNQFNLAETSNQQVSDLNLCLSDDFFLNIKNKLEDTIKKLEGLEKQIGRLGLKEHFVSTKQETRTPSTSLVDDSGIFGRQNEIENLIGSLLSMDTKGKNLTVVPIVGMGGLGLLQEIGLKVDDNLNQLQVKLKEKLNGKRFLVILDDMWNDNYPEWDDLINLFLQGDIRSKIIVTTPKKSVALMMDSGAIYMGILSSEDSWALFKRHSLENRDSEEHPEFEDVGKQIADKCKVLPLALKALAGILRGKSEVDEWRDILRSEIWELSICSNGILPALMLSYNDLPAHLKQCFAYCAIYPKDYQFCKDQVIHLWIANGLVQQFHSGNQYFLELRSRSLFERVPESEWKPEGVLMHDLVNDLAQIASSNLCIRLEENKGSHMLEQCRHMFYSIGQDEIKKLPDSICALYNLETLLLSHCRFLKELPLQMEKLINLHHLDISNTFCVKMPLHLSKLKSLQVLVGDKFLVGGLRLEDLGEAQNLYGSLSVLESQNVVERREAVKAKVKEKNHVEQLSLEWSESCSADNSQTERDILDELRPHTNIKEVKISGYRGTKFPNWLADPLFLKLVQRDTWNNRGDGRILWQFVLQKPFNSLEKLEFEGMSEWKQWHLPGNGEFPTLEKLFIKNCPELSLETPILLSCLKRFEVIGCPKVGVVFDERMKQIEELYIRDCNSVTSFPFSILPTTLKRIWIVGCRKLKLEVLVDEMFVEYLRVERCDCIDDISPEFFPTACHLSVEDCHNLTRVLIPTATERLTILNCENLKILLVACGGTQMTLLYIEGCWKLKWLPEHMQQLLPSLKELYLYDCPEIESFPQRGLPFNLQTLWIRNCKKLVNGRKEWSLQRLSCLRELSIVHDGSDEEIVGGEKWEFPFSIQTLVIYNLKTLSSQHLKSLISLQSLCIVGNLRQIQSMLEQGQFSSFSHLTSLQIGKFPNLQSLPESALPSSLSRLKISDCSNLQSLSESALPSSLSRLEISYCSNLQSLSESALPSSLSRLEISYCSNLQSLPESALPSSLYQLEIYHCRNLQSLPVKGMPSSLSKLSISECPMLTLLLEFNKGYTGQKLLISPP
ncbi:hypothetical protein KY290_008619 [Solanum tuberosum]|uniref:Uncharacterized protein n=1 Tax=Solanum tuberosum TaxID=4113 RepID=A0ABQ7WAT4_SOLTU|nr:hypothetical protein KY290_008619 [Solanum tuberosum]